MIKHILIISIFFSLSSGLIAQEGAENSYILYCNTNQSEFQMMDVKNCDEISIRDSEFKVVSFVFKTKKKKTFNEVAVQGNQLTEECYALLDKMKDPKAFYIEKVVDSEGTPVDGYRKIMVTE